MISNAIYVRNFLRSHKEYVHEGNNFTCKACDNIFNMKRSLRKCDEYILSYTMEAWSREIDLLSFFNCH